VETQISYIRFLLNSFQFINQHRIRLLSISRYKEFLLLLRYTIIPTQPWISSCAEISTDISLLIFFHINSFRFNFDILYTSCLWWKFSELRAVIFSANFIFVYYYCSEMIIFLKTANVIVACLVSNMTLNLHQARWARWSAGCYLFIVRYNNVIGTMSADDTSTNTTAIYPPHHHLTWQCCTYFLGWAWCVTWTLIEPNWFYQNFSL
jgi:hypothetical protein